MDRGIELKKKKSANHLGQEKKMKLRPKVGDREGLYNDKL